MKAMPKIIYVSLESAGTKDEFLDAQEKPGKLVEADEEKPVGEYRLVRMVILKNSTAILPKRQ